MRVGCIGWCYPTFQSGPSIVLHLHGIEQDALKVVPLSKTGKKKHGCARSPKENGYTPCFTRFLIRRTVILHGFWEQGRSHLPVHRSYIGF